MKRFGRAARAWRATAAARVLDVSLVNKGETSSETPSIYATGQLVNREKKIGSLSEIFDCQVEEEVFHRHGIHPGAPAGCGTLTSRRSGHGQNGLQKQINP